MTRTGWVVLGVGALFLCATAGAGVVAFHVIAQQRAEQQRLAAEEARARELERQRQEAIRRREEGRREFVALVSRAASSHLWTSTQPTAGPADFDAQKQRLSRIYTANVTGVRNGAVASLWADARRHAERGLLLLYGVTTLQETAPSGWEVLESLDRESESDAWWRRLGAEVGQAGLQAQFRETEATLAGTLARLLDHVPALDLPDVAGGVTVSHLPAWRGAFGADTLTLENASNEAMDDAVVFVGLTDRSGATTWRLHYTERWPAHQRLFAHYPIGRGDYANPETCLSPARIEVVVVSAAGVARKTYELTSELWAERVSGYVSQARFESQFLGAYVEDFTERRYGAGFRFRFTGLRLLPAASATVRLISDGEYRDVTFDAFNAGEGDWFVLRANPTPFAVQGAELVIALQDAPLSLHFKSGEAPRLERR